MLLAERGFLATGYHVLGESCVQEHIFCLRGDSPFFGWGCASLDGGTRALRQLRPRSAGHKFQKANKYPEGIAAIGQKKRRQHAGRGNPDEEAG